MSNSRTSDVLSIYTQDVARYPLLTPTQEREIGAKALAGDLDAQQDLVNANLRFVIAVAKKYRNRGVPFMDLIQAGNIGLQSAARKFNPEMGVRFIAYAIHWVRQMMQKEIDATNGSIRASQTQMVRNRTVRRKQEEARQRLGRDLTVRELMAETDFTKDRVLEALNYRVTVHSLDQPVNAEDGGSTPLSQMIGYDDGREEREESVERRQQVDRVLGLVLSDREKDIVQEYYGIGTRKLSLSEIGHRRGVTRERARQLKHRALKKLRQATEHHETLKEFFLSAAELESRAARVREEEKRSAMEGAGDFRPAAQSPGEPIQGVLWPEGV